MSSQKNIQKDKAKFTSPLNDFKKMFKTFFQYIRHRGLSSGLIFLFNSLREWLWFASHRKSSVSLINLFALEKGLDNKEHSTFYVPTPIIPFFKLIRNLNVQTHRSVFVDYGAGKGRAMILAAECGFCKVKGMEFSLSLYKLAQKNIQAYVSKSGKNCFQLIHIDAESYQVQKEDNFFYFFHPFNDLMLKKCLKNIYLSLKKNPRKAFLVYQSGYKDKTKVITEEGGFTMLKTFKSFGVHFYAYEYKP